LQNFPSPIFVSILSNLFPSNTNTPRYMAVLMSPLSDVTKPNNSSGKRQNSISVTENKKHDLFSQSTQCWILVSLTCWPRFDIP
jgi:hypothetical protein